jgi:VanZ family protein
MVFISIASTDLMSADHTSRFISPFLRWFAPGTTDATIASVQLVVRKCAHLTEYAILAALLWRALNFSQHRIWRAAGIALLIAALCASLDEFHQAHVTSRTGSPWDVLIDSIGAVIGLALCLTFHRKRPASDV